jgi:hypothetical protein
MPKYSLEGGYKGDHHARAEKAPPDGLTPNTDYGSACGETREVGHRDDLRRLSGAAIELTDSPLEPWSEGDSKPKPRKNSVACSLIA